MMNGKGEIVKYIMCVIIGEVSGTLSSMGLGGGGLLVPALYFLEYNQKQAQLTNLIVYIPVALISTYINFRNDLIDKHVMKVIILPTLCGAILGSIMTNLLDGDMIKKIFALVMIALGMYQLNGIEKG